MYQDALQIYKQTDFQGLSAKEIGKRLFQSLLADIKDYRNASDRKRQVYFATHAQQILYMIMEHLNERLSDDEFTSIYMILRKVNHDINKSIYDSSYFNEEIIPAIEFLVDVTHM
jgi:flagellin-specific chaperone FliS